MNKNGRLYRLMRQGMGLITGALFSGLVFTVQAMEPAVNIILILADDVGAETVGVYGGESYRTPHLDQLARDGIRFDHGHAQPLCTPSRVKVMTGQYNFRNYRQFGHLEPGQPTIAHMLGSAGYRTAVVGKWQLSGENRKGEDGAMPGEAGFDQYLLWQIDNQHKGARFWGPLLNHNGDSRQHDSQVFGPDVLNNYVLDYIQKNSDQPFFLYYPMVLAHSPWVTTPDMRDRDANDQKKFAAMLAYMDKMVGNVRSAVERASIADRTLILFLGDNGTGREITSRNSGKAIRGGKGKTIGAASRVPFVAWGPGIVRTPGVSISLVNLNDIFPTLAELAGAEIPMDYPGDGKSLVPILQGKGELDRQNIFIHFEPRKAGDPVARYAFDRRWKLYENGDFFDMQEDPLEKAALSSSKLDSEAEQAYQALRMRIDSMPSAQQY